MNKTKAEPCSLFYLQRFHNEFMKQWIITLGRLISRRKRAVSEAYWNLISGRDVLRQVETSKNQQMKKKGSKGDCLKIFFLEYVFTTLGKLFGIK